MTKKNGSKKRDAKRRLVRFYKFQLLRLKLTEKKKSMLMPRTRLESQPQRLKMIGSKAKVLMDHWQDPGSMISASGTMWNLRKHSGTNGS
jgi:hypothetical protein